MAGHVQVIKLVAEVAVVPDAGEKVKEELGRAEADQRSSREPRKRFACAVETGLSGIADGYGWNPDLRRKCISAFNVFLTK
jgi:hypothetical protein